jgi:hypothetical protein
MTPGPIAIECRNLSHPKGRVAKIDTFELIRDSWSGDQAWRGRLQKYATHGPVTERERSLRIRLLDGHVRVRLTCPEPSCGRHVVRREEAMTTILDTLAAKGRVTADLTEL